MRGPLVQIAIDVNSLGEALPLVEGALAAGADWVELGKPLVEFEGINAMSTIVRQFPQAYFLLDLMIVAAPKKYVDACAAIGVRNVTVTALAPRETVCDTIESGKNRGVEITVDLFNVGDLVGEATYFADRGADYVMVHFGVDQKLRRPKESPIDDLRRVTAAVDIPVAYATYDVTEATRAVEAGAAIIVQGNPLLKDPDPLAAFRHFINSVKSTERATP